MADIQPLGRYSGFNRKQRTCLDGVFDELEAGLGSGPEPEVNLWTPANLSTPIDAVNFGIASTTSLATFSMHIGGVHGGLISTADRNKMFGWALHRAGLAELLPAAHPYKASAPTT